MAFISAASHNGHVSGYTFVVSAVSLFGVARPEDVLFVFDTRTSCCSCQSGLPVEL